MKKLFATVFVIDETTGKTYTSGDKITEYSSAVPEQICTEARNIRDMYGLKPENCRTRYEVTEDD